MTDNNAWQDYAHTMTDGYPLQGSPLCLQIGDCVLQVKSNSELLLDRLRVYFRHTVISEQVRAEPDIELVAVQREPVILDVPFRDWRREQGKTGRKDACHDLPGARLVHKVRTGMMFLQSEPVRIAAGDCLENDNQVINFINAQYMNWLQQRGWLICHAAGIARNKALAIAAFSGGGKSTSMLRFMDIPACRFLSNDRLFIRIQSGGDGVEASGVPKLPRINPGTIVTNPALQDMISPERREELLAMPRQQLWDLEEKYDVDVLETYGADRIRHVAPLAGFLILNWQHTAEPMQITPVSLAERRDLLPALMKSPGPFYQKADGDFYQDLTPLDEQAYIDTLQGVSVYEVSGGVDFDGLVQWYRDAMLSDNGA